MSKRFYVVIPFTALQAQTESSGIFSTLKGMFSTKKAAQTTSPEQFATAHAQLQQRAEIILGGLSGIGIRGHLLRHEETVQLFTNLYNPTPSGNPA